MCVYMHCMYALCVCMYVCVYTIQWKSKSKHSPNKIP